MHTSFSSTSNAFVMAGLHLKFWWVVVIAVKNWICSEHATAIVLVLDLVHCAVRAHAMQNGLSLKWSSCTRHLLTRQPSPPELHSLQSRDRRARLNSFLYWLFPLLSRSQIRFISSPSKCEFIMSFVNIIDYIATASFLWVLKFILAKLILHDL